MLCLLALLVFPPLASARKVGGGFTSKPISSSYSKPVTGYPAYTAVGVPVNRPMTYPSGFTPARLPLRTPGLPFFPGTMPLYLFGAYALTSNREVGMNANGTAEGCELPTEPVDASQIINNLPAVIGTGEQSTAPAPAPGPSAPAPTPKVYVAPSPEEAVSEADRQAVLTAVESGELHLDSVSPTLINGTYLESLCKETSSAAAARNSLAMLLMGGAVVTFFLF